MTKGRKSRCFSVYQLFGALNCRKIKLETKKTVLRTARAAINENSKDRTKEQRESLQTVKNAMTERMRELCQRVLEIENALHAKSYDDATTGQRLRQYLEDMDKTTVLLRSLNHSYEVALLEFEAATSAYEAKHGQAEIDPLAVMRDKFTITDALHVRKMLHSTKCDSPKCQEFVEFLISPGSPIDENLIRASQCDGKRRRVIYKALVNVVPVVLKMWIMSNEKDKQKLATDVSQKFNIVRALAAQIDEARMAGIALYGESGALVDTITENRRAGKRKMTNATGIAALTKKLEVAQNKVDFFADLWATFVELSYDGPRKRKVSCDDLYIPVLDKRGFGWLPTKRLPKKMSFMEAKKLSTKPRVQTPDNSPRSSRTPREMTRVRQGNLPSSNWVPYSHSNDAPCSPNNAPRSPNNAVPTTSKQRSCSPAHAMPFSSRRDAPFSPCDLIPTPNNDDTTTASCDTPIVHPTLSSGSIFGAKRGDFSTTHTSHASRSSSCNDAWLCE
eukprot:GEMP01026714.1.p1 GENE.GEMP01026714.1~~GEMP01026714.1.p1  ORF type:complete len:503 (+),score=115.16 GEMP01026714.1:104-1612(+)